MQARFWPAVMSAGEQRFESVNGANGPAGKWTEWTMWTKWTWHQHGDQRVEKALH